MNIICLIFLRKQLPFYPIGDPAFVGDGVPPDSHPIGLADIHIAWGNRRTGDKFLFRFVIILKIPRVYVQLPRVIEISIDKSVRVTHFSN
jgi:hypothetical protein